MADIKFRFEHKKTVLKLGNREWDEADATLLTDCWLKPDALMSKDGMLIWPVHDETFGDIPVPVFPHCMGHGRKFIKNSVEYLLVEEKSSEVLSIEQPVLESRKSLVPHQEKAVAPPVSSRGTICVNEWPGSRVFVGRQTEIVGLVETLFLTFCSALGEGSDRTRIPVFLTSPGMGKTSLLLWWLPRFLSDENLLNEFLKFTPSSPPSVLSDEQRRRLLFAMVLRDAYKKSRYFDIDISVRRELLDGDGTPDAKMKFALTVNILWNFLQRHQGTIGVFQSQSTRSTVPLPPSSPGDLAHTINSGELFDRYPIFQHVVADGRCRADAIGTILTRLSLWSGTGETVYNDPMIGCLKAYANNKNEMPKARAIVILNVDEVYILKNQPKLSDEYLSALFRHVAEKTPKVCILSVCATTCVTGVSRVALTSGPFFPASRRLGLLNPTDIGLIFQQSKVSIPPSVRPVVDEIISNKLNGVPRLVVDVLLPAVRKVIEDLGQPNCNINQLTNKLWSDVKERYKETFASSMEAFKCVPPDIMASVILVTACDLFVRPEDKLSDRITFEQLETDGCVFPIEEKELSGENGSKERTVRYVMPRVIQHWTRIDNDPTFRPLSTQVEDLKLAADSSNDKVFVQLKDRMKILYSTDQYMDIPWGSPAEQGNELEELAATLLYVRYLHRCGIILLPPDRRNVKRGSAVDVNLEAILPGLPESLASLQVKFYGVRKMKKKFPKCESEMEKILNDDGKHFVYINCRTAPYADVFFFATRGQSEEAKGQLVLVGLQCKNVNDDEKADNSSLKKEYGKFDLANSSFRRVKGSPVDFYLGMLYGGCARKQMPPQLDSEIASAVERDFLWIMDAGWLPEHWCLYSKAQKARKQRKLGKVNESQSLPSATGTSQTVTGTVNTHGKIPTVISSLPQEAEIAKKVDHVVDVPCIPSPNPPNHSATNPQKRVIPKKPKKPPTSSSLQTTSPVPTSSSLQTTSPVPTSSSLQTTSVLSYESKSSEPAKSRDAMHRDGKPHPRERSPNNFRGSDGSDRKRTPVRLPPDYSSHCIVLKNEATNSVKSKAQLVNVGGGYWVARFNRSWEAKQMYSEDKSCSYLDYNRIPHSWRVLLKNAGAIE